MFWRAIPAIVSIWPTMADTFTSARGSLRFIKFSHGYNSSYDYIRTDPNCSNVKLYSVPVFLLLTLRSAFLTFYLYERDALQHKYTTLLQFSHSMSLSFLMQLIKNHIIPYFRCHICPH